MVDFVDIAPLRSSIIMCVGVGGGGGNAVRHLFNLGNTDVTFAICNTDRQALEMSPIPNKIKLGETLTEGLGAGNKPEKGRDAALESQEEIRRLFEDFDTKMVFITAGMGGGTGTGAAPVVARIAKEMDILTVAIVSIPFEAEGKVRIEQAIEGIEEISKYADSLLVIDNENIVAIHGDLDLDAAFSKADDILATAAKSIADIITKKHKVNVDLADVKTVMTNSGVALMGSEQNKADVGVMEIAKRAVESPLLNHNNIKGAKNVLLNISYHNRKVTIGETNELLKLIQTRSNTNLNTTLIWGAGVDDSLGDEVRITVVATGFDTNHTIAAIKEKYRKAFDIYGDVVVAAEPVAPVMHRGREVVNLDGAENVKAEKPRAEEEDPSGFVVTVRSNESEPSSSSVPTTESLAAPVRITEPIAAVATEEMEAKPIVSQVDEKSLDVAAYLRRGVVLEGVASRSGAQRENLFEVKKKQEDKYNNTIGLFDSEE
ncbi:Cell division protein FtsZ [Mucinivorans hirudinis]|uniref:Cell division protein FtsZ n=1 Tax=Mucinivorans hirudinis TaxID=1433126 RepID=A0A060R757_9BACT|nr:Cell division protein FtsZ [Mucinivorans hirudinis]